MPTPAQPSDPPFTGIGRRRRPIRGALWGFALLYASVLIAYFPALRGGFIWDDDAHVTRPELRSVAGLARIWFQLGATQQYYPVVHSAFWLEHRLWGDSPLGYHLLNLLLHATAAGLFALVLVKVGRAVPGALRTAGPVISEPVAWLAALLFALHPVGVESAAWISEEKNTFSTVFYLLSALVFLVWWEGRQVPGPGGRTRRGGLQYAMATVLFVLALLSKSVTATLPAALLLVIWWREGSLRWRRDVRPLLPWFALGAAAGLFTAWVERAYVGARGSDYSLVPADRLLIAGRAIWFYLGKLLWPIHLIFIYPRWNLRPSDRMQWLPVVAALAATAVLVRLARGRIGRAVLCAWLFFVGSLFPALGFINIYPFRYSFVADHFQYLPSLGIFALAGAGLARSGNLLRHWVSGRWRVGTAAMLPWPGYLAAAVLAAGLGVLSWRQSWNYQDGETLYRRTIAANPGCWMAYENLGTDLLESGRAAEAVAYLGPGLRLHPDAEAHFNLGNALRAVGRPDEAAAQYREALRLDPSDPSAHDNLATTLASLGRPVEAEAEYRAALRLEPRNARFELNLGALLQRSRPAEAISCYREALRLRPDYPEAHYNLGLVLRAAGRRDEAISEYEAAIRLRPDYPEARNNLGYALMEAGKPAEAIPQCAEAVRLRPSEPLYENNLGIALAETHRLDEAIAHFQRALALEPGYRQARLNLSFALRDAGRIEEALEQYRLSTAPPP